MPIYLGIDCGGTHLRVGLVDNQGKILAYSRTKSPLVTNPNEFGKAVFDATTELLASTTERYTLDALRSIGLGLPGPIDAESGWLLYSANLHNSEPIKFLDQLRLAFSSTTNHELPTTNLPIFFDRDAEVALIGESWIGEGKDVSNVILLTLGTGIGGAIKADNKIISGVGDHAGEIGHMYLSLVNGKSFGVSGLELNSHHLPITTYQLPTCGLGHEGCFEAMFRAASPEEKPYILGIGMANLVDIFNPERIILGGGIIEYGQINIEEAVAVMQDKAFKPSGQEVSVVKAKLGDQAGVVGAARLAMLEGKI